MGSVPPMPPLADLMMYGQMPPTETVIRFPEGCQKDGGHNPI